MLRTRVEPIGRDIELIISEILSPRARSQAHAQFHRQARAEAKVANTRALGKEPPAVDYVDGARGAALEQVRPDGGRIVTEFDLIRDALAWFDQQLEMHSPVRSGEYRASRRLYADGVETSVDRAPANVTEFTFMPTVEDYAHLIERGWSKKAPDGVYQVVAAKGRARFGRFLKVTYRPPRRLQPPAILLTVR